MAVEWEGKGSDGIRAQACEPTIPGRANGADPEQQRACFVVSCLFCFETGFHFVVQAGLELPM